MLKRLVAFNMVKKHHVQCRRLVKLAFQKRSKKWYIRPIFMDRKLYGAWYSLIPIMREFDPEEHFRFFRMTADCFDELLEKVAPFITPKSNRGNISAGERLAVTLRYYFCLSAIPVLKHFYNIIVSLHPVLFVAGILHLVTASLHCHIYSE